MGTLPRGNWKCRRLNCVKLVSAWMDISEIYFSAWKESFAEFQAFQEVISCDQRRFCIYSGLRHILEMLSRIFCFCHPFLFSSFGFIFLLDLFWENIYDRVKSNFENIGCSDLLFKVSVFVLRCIFGYYRHRARKLERNLTIGQSLSNSCFSKFWKG